MVKKQVKVRRGCPVRCWAHLQSGKRCPSVVKPREGEAEDNPIPYCATHLRVGDQALKVVNHPEKGHGKLLISRTKLPKGYKMVYWGSRTRCPYLYQVCFVSIAKWHIEMFCVGGPMLGAYASKQGQTRVPAWCHQSQMPCWKCESALMLALVLCALKCFVTY